MTQVTIGGFPVESLEAPAREARISVRCLAARLNAAVLRFEAVEESHRFFAEAASRLHASCSGVRLDENRKRVPCEDECHQQIAGLFEPLTQEEKTAREVTNFYNPDDR